ncbi:unnamed protein product [Heligmosomoides polygyrus]|uniref:Kazal-like domain-containing protein n=1 Tax=Heligmosomoides polygyrus TaxID=6339 RepID=A0A183GL22_HELPZ|nr:unnamed protein product [Heligmosomoides polygyrus]
MGYSEENIWMRTYGAYTLNCGGQPTDKSVFQSTPKVGRADVEQNGLHVVHKSDCAVLISVNKVRCIGYGMFLVGIGALLLILPHFVDGVYVVGFVATCVASFPIIYLVIYRTTVFSSYPILLLSQLLIGFGAAPLFTYGYSTIDEFDSHKRTGNNMAIFMGVSTVGPALAFIGGGYLLTIWGDIGKSNYLDLGITGPTDPRWYGAWWIGFLLAGLASFVTSLPLCMFPKKLNDTDERKKNDVIQTHAKLNMDFSGDKFAYFKIFKMFLFNKTCMALIAMQTAESMIMNGYITFIPKLFENLFGFSSSWSSTVTGLIIVPMGLIGSFVGGKLGEKVENRFSVGEEVSSLSHPCNLACHCDRLFNPVCAFDTGISYFSPCHAGCTTRSAPKPSLFTQERQNMHATTIRNPATCTCYIFVDAFLPGNSFIVFVNRNERLRAFESSFQTASISGNVLRCLLFSIIVVLGNFIKRMNERKF